MEELRTDDPRWIGSYRLLGRLGTGGMGRVFIARSERGRTVAVKLVRAELAEQDEFRTRFRREVRAARQVGGRWTAPVLDADTEAEIPWVATGYVAGPSLHQVVGKDYGPLPERSVRVLAAGLAHALSDIHAAGLVHRDLKPSNVMITIDGPRVIDFGIARALETVADDHTLTYTGAMVGSPAFMSPEQVRGDRVTPAADIFCLGSVLAYAATGLQPFGAASSGVHAQMFRITQEPPDLAPVPEGLRDLVAACLVKDAEQRPTLAQVRERIGEIPEEADGGRAAEPWLPGAIVAQLGRHAVRLLEMEAAETGSLPVVRAADLPPQQHEQTVPNAPKVQGAPGVRTAPTAGGPVPPTVAGPGGGPAVEAGPGGGPTNGTGPAGTATGFGGVPAAGPAYGAGPTTGNAPPPVARPADAMPPAGAAPPRTAVGAPEPDERSSGQRAAGRGRRGGLIAVLALLAVIAGGTTAYVVVSEGRHDDGKAAGRGGPSSSAPPLLTTAPAAGSPKGHVAPTDPDFADAVKPPPLMVGTWRATLSGTPGDGHDNIRLLDIKPTGRVVLDGQSPDYTCQWLMHVADAGPPTVLSPSMVVSAKPAGLCEPGGSTSLVLVDQDHLRRDNIDSDKAPLTYERIN
ncbi:protein kinase domain-containing protein [Streptomyces sp. CA-111067]|uniref:serine/threonine-protein kinase n=1 Tax=Streptomyces sp. CA-111067 TaxID=3240046 RepID=UPI003D97D812